MPPALPFKTTAACKSRANLPSTARHNKPPIASGRRRSAPRLPMRCGRKKRPKVDKPLRRKVQKQPPA